MPTETPKTGNATARVDRLDACLPQTQCTLCGYPRCRDYAQALADGAAAINQCPPGGDATIALLARLLGRPAQALDARFGAPRPRVRAVIDEPRCIGCRKCLDACPVDAIVGAPKLMHTIIAADCSGCALCLPPCPVDCIVLIPAAAPRNASSAWPEYGDAEAARWRRLAAAHFARLARRRDERAAEAARAHNRAERRAEIRAAVARVRAKRTGASR
jgi:electron transport complex protein RnfB